MPEVLYALVALVLVGGAVWYFFLRAKPSLPAPEEPEALPKPKAAEPSPKAAEPAKVEPAKTAEPTKTAEPARASQASPKVEPAPTVKPAEPAVEAARASIPVAAPPREPEPEVAPARPSATAPAPTPAAPADARAVTLPRVEGDVSALKRGLAQTRGGWMQRLLGVFSGKKEIDASILETIEETLITGDVGMATTRKLVDGLQARLERKELSDADRVWDSLREDSRAILNVEAQPFGATATKTPFVVMVVGVNGAGKTTTIAKLAGRYKDAGRKVLLAAGDTFRAAAVQQLEMWGKRVGVDVHKGKDGARPQTVMFETVQRGVNEGYDVVLADTAGRLQTKIPLMEELRKIREAAGKACPGAPHEILLVLDATTGQNAISQAREFREALELTGVVLTKLDGTARGGVILAVADEFKLPVRFVGVGEKADDLRDFVAAEFVEALFTRAEEDAA